MQRDLVYLMVTQKRQAVILSPQFLVSKANNPEAKMVPHAMVRLNGGRQYFPVNL